MKLHTISFHKILVFAPLLLCFSVPKLSAQFEAEICKIAKAEAAVHQKTSASQAHNLYNNFDVTYYRTLWGISPDNRYISGAVHTEFKVLSNLDTLYFDLNAALSVDSVVFHGNSLSYNHLPNHVLEIPLPQTLTAGSMDSVSIHYQGVPPANGFGSFEQTSHNGHGIIWTLSEPYGAKDWWPCKQSLEDKADSIDIWVITDAGNKVASNGTLERVDTIANSLVRFHWKHRYPIPAYLVAVAVTNYVEKTRTANLSTGTLPIVDYAFPEDSAAAFSGWADVIPVLELLDTLIEPYPFMQEKYGHAQFGWGGGMEHTTMSFMGGFDFGLIVHELAHQWYGDKVTCGSWSDIWLNEGFATYLTGVSYEHLYPPNVWELWKQQTIASVVSQPGGSVHVDDTTNISRIFSGRLTYNKGAMLLHMLRWKLGTDIFYQAIRDYISDPKLAFGFAHTEDLVYHLEEESGQNLTEFFDDWFYGEGYPIYSIEWQQPATDLKVKINQTTSHSSVNFFEMPVPIRFFGVTGDTTLVFDHQSNGQLFEVTLPFKADSVVFDPEHWLVARLNAIERVTEFSVKEEKATGYSIYPNPANEALHIEGCWKNLKLYDQAGGEILHLERKEADVCKPFTLNIPEWPQGVYFVKLDEQVRKVVVRE